MTPESLFQAALSKVESLSIRAWAQTDHNRPIMLKLAALQLEKPSSDPVHLFAAFIVSSAIGL
jgi:hypothetical protein